MALEVFYTTKKQMVDKAFLDKIYLATLKHFNLKDDFLIELTIVGEKRIKSTNFETRGIDRVTDILSFPAINFSFPYKKGNYIDAIDPESNKIVLGELMLCYNRAIAQAKAYNHSLDREVGFLVLHGLLHLLGFDHIEKNDEAVMMGHAKQILDGLNLKRDV